MSVKKMYFEDLQVGKKFTTPGRTVTETDIVLFSGISGDYDELHTNEEFAKGSLFKTRIAHGQLTLAISHGLFQRVCHRGGEIAFLGMNNFRLPAPVMAGDTLTMDAEVIKRRVSSKPGRGVVTFKHTIRNQRGETVCEYETVFLMKRVCT